MPSVKEEAAAACQDFVEELVSEIKENLRLSSAGLKATSAARYRKSSRASPYNVAASRQHGQQQPPQQQQQRDDPYEMLQELLRDGSLIKEAVRRLQKGDAARVCSLEI